MPFSILPILPYTYVELVKYVIGFSFRKLGIVGQLEAVSPLQLSIAHYFQLFPLNHPIFNIGLVGIAFHLPMLKIWRLVN